MSDIVMDLHAHYKAVKARLNAGRIQPPPMVLEAAAEPPELVPEAPVIKIRPEPRVVLDFLCSPETKAGIVQILRDHNMMWHQAMGPKRTRPYLMVRAEIYVWLRERGWSYPRIGRLCGKRDHTTVLNSLNRYSAWKDGQWKRLEAI